MKHVSQNTQDAANASAITSSVIDRFFALREERAAWARIDELAVQAHSLYVSQPEHDRLMAEHDRLIDALPGGREP
jgi:hypothetical protein